MTAGEGDGGGDPFEELRAASESLHEEVPRIGNAIVEQEQRIRAIAPAIEVWLDEQPLARQDLSVSASTVASHVEVHLGYAPDPRPGRTEWCLCLRRAEFAERPFVEGEVLVRVIRVQRLVDAPEDQQLTALGRIPALVRAIAATVRARSEQIRGAGGDSGA